MGMSDLFFCQYCVHLGVWLIPCLGSKMVSDLFHARRGCLTYSMVRMSDLFCPTNYVFPLYKSFFLGYALFSSLRWKILSLVMKTLYPRKSSFHVLRLLKQTVRQTGWSVRGFWVIISRFSRLRLENLSIITQKPLTDHPVFLTVFSKS